MDRKGQGLPETHSFLLEVPLDQSGSLIGLCMEVADKVQDGGPWTLLGPVGQDPNIMRGTLIMLRPLQATGHRPQALCSLLGSFIPALAWVPVWLAGVQMALPKVPAYWAEDPTASLFMLCGSVWTLPGPLLAIRGAGVISPSSVSMFRKAGPLAAQRTKSSGQLCICSNQQVGYQQPKCPLRNSSWVERQGSPRGLTGLFA